ncbi:MULTISPECIES: hypothetical protein [Bradyrhizobium]|uniref:hypothetical protein n=1 Tax=Bradyrhizobium TaxID=374 RepID=UPI001008DC8F|nr:MULTISPECIES: hypothetical protein [Bradyrhizobium]
MRRKGLMVILGLIVAIGIGLYATFQSRYLIDEHNRARIVSLQQTASGLDALEQGDQKAVAVALDATLFRNIGDQLVGQKVMLSHPSLPGETLTVAVDRLTFAPQMGRLAGNLGLSVKSDKRFLSVGLDVEFALYFSGVSQILPATTDRPAVFAANFRLLPVSIEPVISFGFLNLVGRGFVSDIITGNVVNGLSERLTLSAPYQPQLRYTLDENKSFEQKFGDGNTGTLKYRVTHEPISVERWAHVIAPIFSDRGVLLAATLDETVAQPFDVNPSKYDTIPTTQISSLEQQLTGRIALANKYYSGKQLTISINTGAIATLTDGIFGALRKLSLSLASTEVSGRFVDKHWSDKILGDGGFYVEAAGGDRIHGSISVPAANFNYVPGKGLEGSLGLSISVDAAIHVHVDPLIGGGIGTTAGLKGSTNPTVSARIAFSSFTFEGKDVALLSPVLSCTSVDLKVETDGTFKTDYGWTKVPSIGVITSELIGADPSDPTILSGIPVVVPVLAKTDAKGSVAPPDQMVIREGLYLTAEATRLTVDAASTGYVVGSDFVLKASNQAPDPKAVDERIQRLTAAAKDFWRKTQKPNCPEKPALRVLVGDLEFGSNNEIIKFIRNAWNDITKGPGKDNEVVKLLDRINGAAKDYDDATRKLAGEVGEAAKNAFPRNNDIGRAAGEVAKSVTKAVTNPGGAVIDLGKQILCGFC